MKSLKLKYKSNNAKEVANIIGTHGFVNLVCYTESDGLFETSIIQWLAIPEDKEDTAVAKLNAYIVKP